MYLRGNEKQEIDLSNIELVCDKHDFIQANYF